MKLALFWSKKWLKLELLLVGVDHRDSDGAAFAMMPLEKAVENINKGFECKKIT
jgi:hypothetical protein